MQSMRAHGAFPVVVCALLLAISTVAAQQSTNACPLTDFSQVDWLSAKESCGSLDSPSFCGTCICGVGVALVTGLEAAGVKINGQSITSLATADPGSVNGLLTQCSATLGAQLLQSGALTSAAVAQLTKCDVQAASNTCLGQFSGPTPPLAAAAAAAAPVATAGVPTPSAARSAGSSVSAGVTALPAVMGAMSACVLLLAL